MNLQRKYQWKRYKYWFTKHICAVRFKALPLKQSKTVVVQRRPILTDVFFVSITMKDHSCQVKGLFSLTAQTPQYWCNPVGVRGGHCNEIAEQITAVVWIVAAYDHQRETLKEGNKGQTKSWDILGCIILNTVGYFCLFVWWVFYSGWNLYCYYFYFLF